MRVTGNVAGAARAGAHVIMAACMAARTAGAGPAEISLEHQTGLHARDPAAVKARGNLPLTGDIGKLAVRPSSEPVYSSPECDHSPAVS